MKIELTKMRQIKVKRKTDKMAEVESMTKNAHVDLAFLVDCTGSMRTEIEEVKNTIDSIVKNCKQRLENDLNLAFVGYRDYQDEPVETLDFTKSVAVFKNFMEKIIKAEGGDDTCEDVFSGLNKVVTLSWKNPVRILVHIGDAPQHGSRFHNLTREDDSTFDDYYQDRNGLSIERLIEDLKDRKISYFFGELNKNTSKMIDVFNDIAGANFVQAYALPDINLNILSNTVISSAVYTHVFKAVAERGKFNTHIQKERSMKIREVVGKIREDVTIVESQPNWEEIDFQNAKTIEFNIKRSRCKVEFERKVNKVRHVKVSKHPFKKGTERFAHYCSIGKLSSSANYVAKSLQYRKNGRDDLADYEKMVKKQQIAAHYATMFNLEKPVEYKSIRFLTAKVLQIPQEESDDTLYAVEAMLPNQTKFMKFTNNWDFVKPDMPGDSTNVLTAFSHYTYVKSKGYYLVADLQGVEDVGEFILTDPSIHSLEMDFNEQISYEGTDLGTAGMKIFVKTHTCSDVCKKMKLKVLTV